MGKWEMVRLGDVLEYEQPLKYIVVSTLYNNSYNTPVLTPGKAFILGYTNEEDNLYSNNLPVIIFDDFTTAIQYVDFPFKVKSSAIKILSAKENANIKFLFYYMSTIKADTELHKRYWISQYSNKRIPLPPLPIQQKIADVLDRSSILIEKRKAQIEKLNLLVKSRFVEMFGDPDKYEQGKVDSVCVRIVGGGTPSKSKPEYYTGEIPWVTPKDMKSWLIMNSIDHITEEAVENSSTKIIPEKSVLMVIRSGILKHTLPIAINAVPVTINQDMKAFIVSDKITPEFLMYSFEAHKSELLSSVRAVTADNIEFGIIRNLIICLPPLDLQHRFADFVRATDKSKCELQHGLTTLELLNKSLMQKCFNGEIF